MKLNSGIITEKLAATKLFYTRTLDFGVSFENDFYLLLHTPDHSAEISFLLPDHPSQQPFFRQPFQRQGMYLTIEVDDVDAWYQRLKKQGIEMKIDIRDEPWGDRHFAIEDPNGIGIDMVTYTSGKTDAVPSTNNKVTWFSIPADDMQRATAFYKAAFDWQIGTETKEDNDDYSYFVALNSRSDAQFVSEQKGVINGCIVKRKIGLTTPAVLIEVDDLDSALEKVKKHGGKAVTEKVFMKSMNAYFVLVRDTEGNLLELLENVK